MHRHHTGVLTARRHGWRSVARRLGAALGTLALALQCLAFVAHATAQAASASGFPFNEPAAWCGMPEMAPASLPQGKAPLRGGMVCPVCQTVQVAAAGLVPPTVVLLPPAAVDLTAPAVAAVSRFVSHGRFSASPRGPPVLL